MSTKKKAGKKKPELTPPDRDRCQAEKPNGNTFMTLGGRPGLVRCENKPVVIIHETEPDRNGLLGSMSLCQGCLKVFNEQQPGTKVRLMYLYAQLAGKEVTIEQIEWLAEKHINRFEALIRRAHRGAAGIRLEECEHYHGIWSNILKVVKNGLLEFSKAEKTELEETISSGELDGKEG